jgi:glycosyltransferase involved in cell wall biosynthesis
MPPTPQRYMRADQDGSTPNRQSAAAISILLPTYNGALFLDEQLNSVLSQSFRDFELLIYDDASSDDTCDIVQSFADRDSRVSFWRGTKNCGQGEALRFLLEQATAPLVSFCDQDDIWHIDKLALLNAGIGAADLAYGTSYLIDEEGSHVGASIFYFAGRAIEGTDPVRFLVGNTVSGHAMLVRREIVTIGHFDQPMPYDWLIAAAAAATNGIVCIKDSVTYHRIHDGNQMNAFGRNRRPRPEPNRDEKLRNLLCVMDAVADAPAARQATKTAFAKLRLATQPMLNGNRWYVRAPHFATHLESVKALSAHDGDVRKLDRLYLRFSRGWLHPTVWKTAVRQKLKRAR